MVRHIICFKLTDGSAERCEEAKSVLLGMEGKVPEVRHITVNVDKLRSARSADVMLDVLLDDWKALDAYQIDTYHCDVVKKYMHAHTERSVAMDFEV